MPISYLIDPYRYNATDDNYLFVFAAWSVPGGGAGISADKRQAGIGSANLGSFTTWKCWPGALIDVGRKAYFEVKLVTDSSLTNITKSIGVTSNTATTFNGLSHYNIQTGNGQCGFVPAFWQNGVQIINAGCFWDQSDVVGLAVDRVNHNLWFSINGTWVQGDPGTNTNAPVVIPSTGVLQPHMTLTSCGYAPATFYSAAVFEIRSQASYQTYPTPTGFDTYQPLQ